jgi:hypothetical protein
MGIAIHYEFERIYWVDRNTSKSRSVLRSCGLDGAGYLQTYLYQKVGNITVSLNLTDLVINIADQNTAYFIDSGKHGAILATNLDFPKTYNNDSVMYDYWMGYYATREVVSKWNFNIEDPQYLLLDDNMEYLLWSDRSRKEINFYRYTFRENDQTKSGTAFQQLLATNQIYPDIPVGLLLDRGLGTPRWGKYLDCYGKGVCTGLAGNWECQCFKGYFGDCQARTCPTGRAWFHEPAVDEMAHDEYVECSNMGVCDRSTGQCKCREGYSGAACERRHCVGNGVSSFSCNNRGRCVPLRRLAQDGHKNEYLEPAPIAYGTLASDPATWDADMIYGCLADEYGSSSDGNTNNLQAREEYNISTHSGADLSVLECPAGYDSNKATIQYGTEKNFSNTLEVQTLLCHATGGYFTLTFRGVVSSKIYAVDTQETFQEKLSTMQYLGSVTVSPSVASSTVCSENGQNTWNITMSSVMGGNIPLLAVASKALSGWPMKVTITRSERGSATGLLQCSGHGWCNTQTGRCDCWEHFGPSDGAGNAGPRGDCGFREVIR